MKRRTPPPRDQRALGPEELCDAMGDAIAALIPPAPPVTDAQLDVRFERALAGGGSGARAARGGARPGRGPRGLLVAALVVATAAAAAVWAFRRAPAPELAYQVIGGQARPDGRVDTGSGQTARIQFADGTSVALGERSSAHVKPGAGSGAGAGLALERGRASFAVVHHPGSAWLVEVGPFRIVVTGTRFDVRWAEARGGLEVTLREGKVTVYGAMAGTGVPLLAGQRLIADLARGLLSVAPVDQEVATGGAATAPATGATPPAPARIAAPPARKVAAAIADRRTRRHAADDRESPAEGPEPASENIPSFGAPRRELLMNAGGDLCSSFVPQFGFEASTEGFTVATRELLALRSRSLDHTHSWCGKGSLRLEAEFNQRGSLNSFATPPNQTGQVMVNLGQPVDLTDKLVTVHVYVDAPARVQFGVQVFAINRQQGKWIGGGVDSNIAAGRWWTVRAVFDAQSPLLKGGASPIRSVDGLAFQIYATGPDRTWTGTVFIDDVGWR